MKTKNRYLTILTIVMMFTFSQQSYAQLANFYSSTNYSNFLNNMISNSIWNSSMEKYTKQYTGRSESSHSESTTPSSPPQIPEYRRYPAVQFKSTGTRLTLQEYLDAVKVSPQEKEDLKIKVLTIFELYEAEATRRGYPNDWALAYVSYVGLNSHIYHGKTEKLQIPFEQNLGLRDVVAEFATDNGLFNEITDREKQELYELLIIIGGLTYHYYEKACREGNAIEIEACRLTAAQNLKLLGIKVEKDD